MGPLGQGAAERHGEVGNSACHRHRSAGELAGFVNHDVGTEIGKDWLQSNPHDRRGALCEKARDTLA